MALMERGEASIRQVEANRANAQKSTGPRTARGKRGVARNASKRGLLTDMFTASMKDLGEDPAGFQRLHGGFRHSLRPANLLEEALVADLAKLWWKKARAERAQAAFQVKEVEQLERAHRQKLVGMDPQGRAEGDLLVGQVRVSKDCATNYHQVIGPLMFLLEAVEKGDCLEDTQGLLSQIYGRHPTPRGTLIKQMFPEWKRAAEGVADAPMGEEKENPGAEDEASAFLGEPGEGESLPPEGLGFQELLGQVSAFRAPRAPSAPGPAAGREPELRAALWKLLLEEIQEVTREYELYQAAQAALTPAQRLAQLVPCDAGRGGRGNAWTLMLRQEASLERQLDRKLRLLLKLREARPGNAHQQRRGPPPRRRDEGGGSFRVRSGRRGARRLNSRAHSAPRIDARNANLPQKPKQSRYVRENTRAAPEKCSVAVARNGARHGFARGARRLLVAALRTVSHPGLFR